LQAEDSLSGKARPVRHRHVIKLCESSLKPFKTPRAKLPSAQSVTSAKLMIRKALFDATGEYVPVSYFPTMEAVPAFMAHKDAKKLLATPALNPDELVYANGSAMWVDKLNTAAVTRKIQSLADRGQKVPAAFIVKGLGLFVAADKTLAGLIAEITETSLKIRMHAARFGGVLAQLGVGSLSQEACRRRRSRRAGESHRRRHGRRQRAGQEHCHRSGASRGDGRAGRH